MSASVGVPNFLTLLAAIADPVLCECFLPCYSLLTMVQQGTTTLLGANRRTRLEQRMQYCGPVMPRVDGDHFQYQLFIFTAALRFCELRSV